jgi:hypothetical protein
LVSHVLYGELVNRIVELIDTTTEPRCRVFDVHSTAAGDQLLASARLVRTQVAAQTRYMAGDWYEMAAGIFHETVVEPDRQIVTIALGRTVAGACDRSLGGLGTPSHFVPRHTCSRAETVDAAIAIRELLGRRHTGDRKRWTGALSS